jgi:sarcosine oxidase / L-pipecolate oxidase
VDIGGIIMSYKEVRERFLIFKKADWRNSYTIYYNPKSGWADAKEVMRAILDTVIEKGVLYRKGTVTSFLLKPDGSCGGLRLLDGAELAANVVILYTGANTAKLLANTAPNNRNFYLVDRIIAAGAV